MLFGNIRGVDLQAGTRAFEQPEPSCVRSGRGWGQQESQWPEVDPS